MDKETAAIQRDLEKRYEAICAACTDEKTRLDMFDTTRSGQAGQGVCGCPEGSLMQTCIVRDPMTGWWCAVAMKGLKYGFLCGRDQPLLIEHVSLLKLDDYVAPGAFVDIHHLATAMLRRHIQNQIPLPYAC